jgi:predicted DNA-binding transcriptional regulator YafY
VLEDRFAYSKPLRLALVSLTQGRPELLTQEAPPLAVLPEAEAARAAAPLPKLQAAIADRKTVVFTYYSIGRDEEHERQVDPCGLQLVGDEWYLIGYCHLRQGIRTFRLSRIRSLVRHATRATHDFATPADFDLAAYRDRPPWQLGPRRDRALIRIDSAMAWWVEAHFAHCGTLTPEADGGVLFATDFAATRPLISWALGLGLAATIQAPAELRAEMESRLDRLLERLDHTLPAADQPAVPTRRDVASGKRTATGQVDVDRFTRLTSLTTYLLHRCDPAGEVTVPVRDICTDLDTDPTELRADVRLLNLVNFGGDGALLWAEFKGATLRVTCDLAGPAFARPARLSPLQTDTLLLAVELVGGQLPLGSGVALASAAEKLRRARHAAPPTLAADDILPPQEQVLGAINTAIKDHRLLEIEYWSEGPDTTTSRTVEPYLMVRSRGEWYYVSYCRRSQGTRTFRVATTKRARLQDEHFVPRRDIGIELYRSEGIPSSEQYAARAATVWYSPAVARWIAERQTTRSLLDGACLATQPYADESWLVHHVLRFGGEAVPLSPPEAVNALRAATDQLRERYTHQL